MNVLVSEAYLSKSLKLMQLTKRLALRGHSVMIDSGAYTNFGRKNLGRPPAVHLSEYCDRCVSEYSRWAWGYVVLDVVADERTTEANTEAMLARGLAPMPVLQIGADAARTTDLVAIDPRVCIAGAVYGRKEWIVKRYADAMKASDGRVKIHALGYGRVPDMFGLPIASCDSSSASNGGKWGGYTIYKRHSGKMIVFPGKQGLRKPYPKQDRRPEEGPRPLLRHLAKCGMKAEQINKAEHWRSGDASIGMMLTFAAYLLLADHAMQLGYRYFIALTNHRPLATLAAVHHHLRPDGSFDYWKVQATRTAILDGMQLPFRRPLFGSKCWDDAVAKEDR